MRASTETLLIALGVLAFFVVQFWLAYGQPAWGLDSPFAFTILRSLQMPVLLGLSAAALAWASKSPSERMLLYSVVAATRQVWRKSRPSRRCYGSISLCWYRRSSC